MRTVSVPVYYCDSSAKLRPEHVMSIQQVFVEQMNEWMSHYFNNPVT